MCVHVCKGAIDSSVRNGAEVQGSMPTEVGRRYNALSRVRSTAQDKDAQTDKAVDDDWTYGQVEPDAAEYTYGDGDYTHGDSDYVCGDGDYATGDADDAAEVDEGDGEYDDELYVVEAGEGEEDDYDEVETKPVVEDTETAGDIETAGDMETGGDMESKAHYKPYGLSMIDRRIYIEHVPSKGRCLFAKHATLPGEILFVESPVLAAVPSVDHQLWEALQRVNEEEALSLPPVWHLAAIVSLTRLDLTSQKIIMNKFVPDPDAAPTKDVFRVLESTGLALDPRKYERALNAWRYNGFGHQAESDGLILYDRKSQSQSVNAHTMWVCDACLYA